MKGTSEMKLNTLTTLSFTAALLLPAIAHAAPAVPVSTAATSNTAGVVELTQSLDARKLSKGATIQARLINTVHLANGTKLPSGTLLTATVENDTLQDGNVRLALRFTAAQPKHGAAVPVAARIVAVSTGAFNDGEPDSISVPETLDNTDTSEDVLDVVSGVNLHSMVSSPNSGVFVSKTKSNVKIPAGTQFELALRPAAGATAVGE
jgi:hypothetical protein